MRSIVDEVMRESRQMLRALPPFMPKSEEQFEEMLLMFGATCVDRTMRKVRAALLAGRMDLVCPEMAESEQPVGIAHGFNCEKKPHIGTGHLHAEDDDSPYLIDGLKYCGRCHTYLGRENGNER